MALLACLGSTGPVIADAPRMGTIEVIGRAMGGISFISFVFDLHSWAGNLAPGTSVSDPIIYTDHSFTCESTAAGRESVIQANLGEVACNNNDRAVTGTRYIQAMFHLPAGPNGTTRMTYGVYAVACNRGDVFGVQEETEPFCQ